MATPHLGERAPGVSEFILANRPGVAAYRFGAANTLNVAFAGVTTMFDVPSGATFRSPTLRRSSLSRVGQVYRGSTVAHVDFTDYAAATIHGDTGINFVRVSEIDSTGAVLNVGPILVVPPADFFTSPHRTLTLSGTTPNVAPASTGLPPTGSMVIVLPRMCDDLRIYNDGGGASIFVSLGAGVPEIEVPTGTNITPMILAFGGTAIYLRSGAAVPFRLTASVISGLR
jgi:hypothetical protein